MIDTAFTVNNNDKVRNKSTQRSSTAESDLRWHTSSAVTQVRFCKIFLVSRGFNTRDCESEENEERVTEILLKKRELNVFTRETIEE